MTRKRSRGGRSSPAVRYAFAFAAVLLAGLLFRRAGALVPMLALSLLFAYLALPLCRRLERHLPGTAAALLSVVLPILCLALVLWIAVPVLLDQVKLALQILPQRLREWIAAADPVLSGFGIRLNSLMDKGLPDLSPRIVDLGVTVLQDLSRSGGYLVLLSPILCFYWLRDREAIYHQVLFCVPVRYRTFVSRLLLSIHDKWQLFVRGQLLSAFWVGTVAFAGLWLFRVPFALSGGAVMMLLDLIPTFGPVLATGVIALVTLACEPERLIAALLVCFAAQQIESACVVPLVLGDSLQLHPASVLLSILLGGTLWGTPGMLAAIPVYLALREILSCLNDRIESKTCKLDAGSVQ